LQPLTNLPEDEYITKIKLAMSEFMKNMKEDIDDEDSNLSEEKYDYNVGRDALTFMKFLKNS